MNLSGSLFKYFVALIILVWVPSKIHSQVLIALLFGDKLNSDKLEFGLAGGLNLSDISNLPGSHVKAGLNLGLYFNIKINDRWYIRPEAVPKFPTGVSKLKPYSLGDSNLDSLLKDGEVKRKIKNIALPVLVRYRIGKQLYADAGPQIDLRTKAKDEFVSGDLTYENKIEDKLARFDLGFVFGLSQKFTNDIGSLALTIRYYAGLTDIDNFTEGTQKNSVLQIVLSIPIGVRGKDTKE